MERVFSVAAIATIAIGLVVLLGWLLEIEPLKRLRADLPTMKTNTAVALLLTGVSLLLLRGDRQSGARVIAAYVLATFVTLLGALTLMFAGVLVLYLTDDHRPDPPPDRADAGPV